jgi:RNA polymerase sigma-70 factor, ECF subfamily
VTLDPREVFCRQQHARLVGSLALDTGDVELAHELAQEALARACRHWSRLERMESPVGWLFTVAFNLAHSRGSRRSRRLAAERAASASGPTSVPDPADAACVRRVVAALPRRQRTALVLRYFADLSVRDVAELMRCREGTVKALTFQAISALRHQLALDDELTEETPRAR